MRLANLPKALERARRLPLRRLLDTAARRSWAAARGARQAIDAERLGLTDDGAETLTRAIPGSQSVTEALLRLEAFGGRLPVSAEVLRAAPFTTVFETTFPEGLPALRRRADEACAGIWTVLGYLEAALGTAPDWQADFIHGQRWDPALAGARQPIVHADGPADIKIPWELSRLQHLPTVGYAYALTNDSKYLELVVTQLGDWIAKNPPGLGVNWTNAMEVALRAISMSWAFELCRGSQSFPADLKARVLWSLFAHGHFIRGHLEDGGVAIGNHYVADLTGLLWLGTLYPAFKGAARWRDEAEAWLSDHLDVQVLGDGGDGEASTTYHRLVAELVALGTALSEANGRPVPILRETLARMAHFTSALLKPDGTVPQLGDNDGGRALQLLPAPPLDHRALVSWAALLCEDPSLAAAVPLTAEALLLVGPEGVSRHEALARVGERTGPRLSVFPESGLAVFREDEFYCLCAATPVGQEGAGGHGHNDKLSLELFIGQDLLTDPGSYAYTCDPAARNAFRSTAAHATLQVDGREQNPLSWDLFSLPERSHATVLRCERRGVAGFVWEAEHHGFAPLVHRREVRFESGRLTITDELTGPKRGAHDLVLRFPLAVGLRAELGDGQVALRREGQRVLTLRARSPPGVVWTTEASAYSPNYGARVPRDVLLAKVTHRLPAIVEIVLERAPEV